MKNFQFNSLKSVVNISLAIALLTSSCAQTNNKPKPDTVKSNAVKMVIEKPKMDVQTAVLSGNVDVVKQHILAGTDLNKKDAMSGSTPLITAITFNKNDIAKALINADVDLNIKNNDGSTALHVASFFGRIEMVQMLLDVKADKNVRNNFGATARETVQGSFAEVKPIYEMLQQQLGPLGLQLDLNEIEKTRPVIAIMLQ
ncbi:ankyrin repeat domain-containing protein [Aurantibacter sp.]|uniref:ankyrin repeat domain-containing protein n=1 Tax=Aurantibacter sp. TaxID=2807103 RepID=UPI0032638AC4